VRRLHERPGQVLVATLAVILALLLVVALAHAFHTAAVAGKVARAGEALHLAGFQCHGQAQDLTDARQRLQTLVTGPLIDSLQDVLLQLGDRVGEVAHQFNLLSAAELIGGVAETGLGLLGLHGLDLVGGHAPAQRAFVQTLKAQDQGGALAYQQHPAPQQITHRPGLALVDMAGGQEVQAQQLGQEVGVGNIVGVLLAAVGLHASGIGQYDVIAVILKPVHQPIPVEGRFNSNAGDALLVRFQQVENARQVAGQLLVQEAAPAFIHEPAEGVVAVQVNSSHDLHGGSPVGLGV